eukprot:179549-Chlamydomonas_euryale.AAC.6
MSQMLYVQHEPWGGDKLQQAISNRDVQNALQYISNADFPTYHGHGSRLEVELRQGRSKWAVQRASVEASPAAGSKNKAIQCRWHRSLLAVLAGDVRKLTGGQVAVKFERPSFSGCRGATGDCKSAARRTVARITHHQTAQLAGLRVRDERGSLVAKDLRALCLEAGECSRTFPRQRRSQPAGNFLSTAAENFIASQLYRMLWRTMKESRAQLN